MRKPIYILGGMGPQASVELYRLMIEKSQRDYGAVNNDDYPELVIHSLPVPDFIGNEEAKTEALLMLQNAASGISAESYGCFGIACNTVHLLAPEITKHTKTPLVSMIDEVSDVVANKGVKTVGLLASPTTIKSRLYQEALAIHNIKVVTPGAADMRIVELAIRAVVAGKPLTVHSDRLRRIVDALYASGAEEIVLGCTELPLIFAKMEDLSVVSSLEVLADSLLRKIRS